MSGKRTRAALLLGLGVTLLGLALARWPLAASLEKGYGLDLLFKLRGARPAPEGVAVVAIDDASYLERGIDPLAPWPRELHAELIRTLKAAGARSVAFDVLFEQPRDPATDVQFELALFDAGNVVLGSTVERVEDPRFVQARLVEPWEPFAESAASVAEVALPADGDGRIRECWLMAEDRPSLALAAYEVATGDSSLRLERGTRLIDYYGPPRTIDTVSLYQALEPDRFLPEGWFRDRIVFVGLSQIAATQIGESKDSFPTPFSGGEVGFTYGVEIHATIAGNLLEGRNLVVPDAPWPFLWFAVVAFVGAFAFVALRPVPGLAALALLVVAVWVVGYVAFADRGWALFVALPAFVQLPVAYGGSVVWYYLTTVRSREQIRRAFSRYLSPEMSRRIAADADSLRLGGEEIVGTALFTDIAGFTSITETQKPAETASMLNEYFSALTREIFETEGTLIKYIGDAVFAIWGAPVPLDDHAVRACHTALDMTRLEGKLVTRIGVHTGEMLVGNLGSEQRFDYTAIGDTVNLAARLESLNKTTGTRALISGEVRRAAGDAIVVRRLGRVAVVGRDDPVELFELLGLAGEPTDPDAATIAVFEAAVVRFAEGDVDAARTGFEEVQARRGGRDGPSAWYLTVLAERVADPVVPWDGVIRLTTK